MKPPRRHAADDAEGYFPDAEQLAAIMRIELTRMCCADAVLPEALPVELALPALAVARDVDEPEPDVVELCGFEPPAGIESGVPVTSMRCPL
jgi:hypothetical protein